MLKNKNTSGSTISIIYTVFINRNSFSCLKLNVNIYKIMWVLNGTHQYFTINTFSISKQTRFRIIMGNLKGRRLLSIYNTTLYVRIVCCCTFIIGPQGLYYVWKVIDGIYGVTCDGIIYGCCHNSDMFCHRKIINFVFNYTTSNVYSFSHIIMST